MCLGIPGRITSLDPEHPNRATVEVAGVRRMVDTSLLEDARTGDWIVVHLGFALDKLDADDAQRALALLDVD